MPVFECSRCGLIDNTALGRYWMRESEPLCAECDTGKWHGRFDRLTPTEAGYVRAEGSFMLAARDKEEQSG